MLQKLPKGVPNFRMILEDIGQPKIKDVAKALGVTERTVYRWLNEPETPRIAALALWWLTRWGMSEINCTLVDTNNLFRQYVHALIEENHQLKDEINRLSSIAVFGSANDPTDLSRATLRAEPQRPALASTKELETPHANRLIRPQAATMRGEPR